MSKLRITAAGGLFVATVALAVWENWEAADLAWAAWTAGVVIGGILIALSLASFSLLLAPGPAGLRYGCGILFLILFIVPWYVLQAVAALGLHALYPPAGEGPGTSLVTQMVLTYWPFLLLSVFSELASLPSYWRLAGRLGEQSQYPFLFHGQVAVTARMLLFVWLLVLLGDVGLAGHALYPALLFYYFPWDVLPWRDALRRHQGKQPSRDPEQFVLRCGGGLLSAVGWPCLLAGAFLLSLPLWREGLRSTGLVVAGGVVLALLGVVFALGRSEKVIDRRHHTWTSRLGLGIRLRQETGSLEGISAVLLERVSSSGRVRALGSSEELTVTARDGTAGFYYEVSLTREDRAVLCLWELSFVGASQARALADELAVFLNLRVEERDKASRPSPVAGTTPAPPPPSRRVGTPELGVVVLFVFVFGFLAAFLQSWAPLLTGVFFAAALVVPGKIRDAVRRAGDS
jgi:hypothetical protein